MSSWPASATTSPGIGRAAAAPSANPTTCTATAATRGPTPNRPLPTLRRRVTVPTDELVYASFPISKFEETPDGLIVYGKATDGSVDSDEQIVDPDWSGKALSDWMASGPNVRV